MLHRYPVRRGEFVNDPIATETPDAAVLLATEGSGCSVIHAATIYVRHSRFDLQRKTQAASLVAAKNGTGQAVLGRISNLQCLALPVHSDDWSNRTKRFIFCNRHIVRYICKHVRRKHKAIRFSPE